MSTPDISTLNEFPKANPANRIQWLNGLTPWQRLAFLICGLLSAIYFISFLAHAALVIYFNYPPSFGDGTVLSEATNFAGSGQLYSPINKESFKAQIYGPIYYISLAIPELFFGPAFWYGHLISILPSIIVSFLIWYLARLLAIRNSIAIVGGVSLLTLSSVNYAAFVLRSDMLAASFSTGALAVIATWYLKNKKEYYLLLAAALCLLAAFTRPTVIEVPVAIAIWLFFTNRRAAIKFFLTTATGFITVGLGFMLATSGNIYTHLITFNQVGWNLNNIGFLKEAVLRIPVFIILALLMNYLCLRTPGLLKTLPGLIIIDTAVAAFISLSFLRSGAYLNYFIEVGIGTILLAALCVEKIISTSYQSRIYNFTAALLPALLVLQFIWVYPIAVETYNLARNTAELLNNKEPISREIAKLAATGPILAEDIGDLIGLGVNTDIDDFFIFSQLANSRVIDQSVIVNNIKSKHYAALVLKSLPEKGVDVLGVGPSLLLERYTPGMLEAIKQSYKPILHSDFTWLFVPA